MGWGTGHTQSLVPRHTRVAHVCHVPRPGSVHMFPSGSHWPGPGLSSLPRTEQGQLRGAQWAPAWHQADPRGHTWQDGAAPGAVGHEGHGKLETVTHHHQAVAARHWHGGTSHSCPVLLPCPAGASRTSSSRRRCSSSWLVPVSPSPAGLPAPGASATLSDIAAGGDAHHHQRLLPAGPWPEAAAGPAQPLLPGFRRPQPRPCAASPARENRAEEGDGATKDPRGPSADPSGTKSSRDPSCCLPTSLPVARGELIGPGMSSTPGTGSSSSPGAPGCAAPLGLAPAAAPGHRDRDRHRHRVTGMRRTTGTGIRTSPRAPGRAAPPGYRDMRHPRC